MHVLLCWISSYNLEYRRFITLECFHPSRRDSKRVEIFNKGRKELEWRAETSEPWIILDRKTGTLSSMETLMVSVDWSMVPYGDDVSGEIVIEAGGKKKKVLSLSSIRRAKCRREYMEK